MLFILIHTLIEMVAGRLESLSCTLCWALKRSEVASGAGSVAEVVSVQWGWGSSGFERFWGNGGIFCAAKNALDP